jgi:hypothetical protein
MMRVAECRRQALPACSADDMGRPLLGCLAGLSSATFFSCCIGSDHLCHRSSHYTRTFIYLIIYLITGLLDNIGHCCPVDGPSQTQ